MIGGRREKGRGKGDGGGRVKYSLNKTEKFVSFCAPLKKVDY